MVVKPSRSELRALLCSKYPTVEDRVMYLLERFPRARNNDTYLLILYWRYFDEIGDYILYIPYEVIERATKPETVRRTRQYIQNTLGMYPPTPSTQVKREKAEKAMRRIYAMR